MKSLWVTFAPALVGRDLDCSGISVPSPPLAWKPPSLISDSGDAASTRFPQSLISQRTLTISTCVYPINTAPRRYNKGNASA